ncbi:YdcF family protein [Nocardia arizonensis]|uniref:YdcF family protein n=1 Tax=Nocardia arizonensis TaxID=1141647 RepID=UPI0006D08CC8|nr:YdcF family protein [Nocardia arizonensis]
MPYQPRGARPVRTVIRAALGAVTVAAALLPMSTGLAGGAAPAGATPVQHAALGFRGPGTAIVVLGYGLLPDGSMRPELIARLHAGFAQALLAPASPVIVTGGNPQNGVTEARAMANWLIGHGIPAERVHVEGDAVDTLGNAAESARVMREIGARDAVVVTSADHLDRAVGDFIDAGVTVIGAVTPDQVPLLAVPFGPLS